MFRREEFVVDNMTKKNGHVVSDNVLIIMQISIIKALKELKYIFKGLSSYKRTTMKFLFLIINFLISVSASRNSGSRTRNGANINLSKRYHIVCNIGSVHEIKPCQSKIMILDISEIMNYGP